MRFGSTVALLCLAVAVPASVRASEVSDQGRTLVNVMLGWTAPGDDGFAGSPALYDIRYSRDLITESNFILAAPLLLLPRPWQGGSYVAWMVPNLESDRTYYFAIKTCDETGNWSKISNILQYRTPRGATSPQIQTDATIPIAADLSPARPNPARDQTVFSLSVPQLARVSLIAYDTMGRRVRTIESGDRQAGTFMVSWDLKDDFGRKVGPGLFFVRCQIGKSSFVRRVVATN